MCTSSRHHAFCPTPNILWVKEEKNLLEIYELSERKRVFFAEMRDF